MQDGAWLASETSDAARLAGAPTARRARAPRAGSKTGEEHASSPRASSPLISRMKDPMAARDAARNDEASGKPSALASVAVSSDRSTS
jgi:hypothetical protein